MHLRILNLSVFDRSCPRYFDEYRLDGMIDLGKKARKANLTASVKPFLKGPTLGGGFEGKICPPPLPHHGHRQKCGQGSFMQQCVDDKPPHSHACKWRAKSSRGERPLHLRLLECTCSVMSTLF